MHTAPATDPLHVHRAVMDVAGPQGLADLVRPLTDDEQTLLDSVLAGIGVLDDSQPGRRPADRVSQFRQIAAVGPVR